ncbi:hypothetical protein [Aquisalimonas sp.]|uniref:hypothetical protein n=1 Tax=Aquisalimonas sp. TaxID=1872621 RepID=UPI0025C24EAE|nr:hypothetical protein [Aquisalimonas sp.]
MLDEPVFLTRGNFEICKGKVVMQRIGQLTLTALIALIFALGGVVHAGSAQDDTDEGAAGIEAEPGVQAGEEAAEDSEEKAERRKTGEPVDRQQEAQPGVQAGEEPKEGAEESEEHQ